MNPRWDNVGHPPSSYLKPASSCLKFASSCFKRDLLAEFVALVGLALADALHLRLVPTVEFLRVGGMGDVFLLDCRVDSDLGEVSSAKLLFAQRQLDRFLEQQRTYGNPQGRLFETPGS
ncbi:MAG: hypothetical protein KAY37_12950 [Phycisphaerae bacterium]|nr:hypothetical protein [Phycisphaerae bacterium]